VGYLLAVRFDIGWFGLERNAIKLRDIVAHPTNPGRLWGFIILALSLERGLA